MTATELCYLTIRDASSRLQSGQLSPVDLTRAFLNRIEQLDDTLQSYITVLPERALAAARAAEADLLQGHTKGPLHGIPYDQKIGTYLFS